MDVEALLRLFCASLGPWGPRSVHFVTINAAAKGVRYFPAADFAFDDGFAAEVAVEEYVVGYAIFRYAIC